MRPFAVVLLIALACGPAGAQETADEQTSADVVETTETPLSFSLHLDAVLSDKSSPVDPEKEALRISGREFRLALWDAPLGRVHYNMAAQQAMLGREGLVHGGRMVGVGLGTTALGDASGSGMQHLVNGTSWSDLSTGERFEVGLDVAISAGILYAIFGGLN